MQNKKLQQTIDQADVSPAQKDRGASEETYSNLLNSLNAGVVVHAPDTSILIANPAASRILGLSEDQMLGKQAIDPQWKFLREDDSDMPLDEYPVHQVLSTREPMRNQVVGVNRPKLGDIAWVLVSGFPVFLKSGQIEQVVINFVDITDRKVAEVEKEKLEAELLKHQRRETELAEAKLAELRQQLVHQTRLATIGQMTASIAHEIRNPLGVMRNAAFYLKRHVPRDKPKLRQHLDIIEHGVYAADHVIRDMLQMARAKEPNVESFDLALTIREVFERMNAVAAVQFDLVSNPDPFMIVADPGQCHQVIFNLVTNAVHAVDGNGEIRVEIRREDDLDLITVQDDGPGVDVEHRDKLFEPLFTTKAKGTGLGLAICREIIERHGGTIELRDHEGPALISGCNCRTVASRQATDRLNCSLDVTQAKESSMVQEFHAAGASHLGGLWVPDRSNSNACGGRSNISWPMPLPLPMPLRRSSYCSFSATCSII